MNKKIFINKHLFRKTFFSNVKEIKEKEYIPSDEINSSWKKVEEMLSTTSSPLSNFQEKPSARRRLYFVASVAASILLIVSFSFWQMYHSTEIENHSPQNQLQELFVSNGKSLEILLSDGTKIYANAGSHIIYPTVFSKDKREISIEGEAYLEVAHNPQAPFIVKANGFDVKVLGTKFNINAYPNERTASVVLVQGSVQIETDRKEKTLLHPNQLAVISAKGTEIQQVDVDKYISWKDHFIWLDEEKLGIVLKRLSIYYGMNFHCNRAEEDIQLSGKLSLQNNAQEMIRILHKTAKLEYMKEDNGYLLYKNK